VDVARVVVDVPLPHLDRVFDYSVPPAMAAEAQPGVRVRVRFSGRLVDGFIVERVSESEHGRLAPLQRVISPVPVLAPDILQLCRGVADRYSGALPDVLRAAIPPRHARAEAAVLATPTAAPALTVPEESAAWGSYVGGSAFHRRVADAEREVRAVWTCAPGGAAAPEDDWPALIASLAATAAAQQGVVIVVPDARDLLRVEAALRDRVGRDAYAVLSADQGPQRRYSAFMRVATGRVRMVLGTRAAAFAPVTDPGLLILWDDGDESLSEPHAPGWHAREVLALRSHLSGAALMVGGFTRTPETQAWIESHWAGAIAPRRDALRRVAPRVQADDATQDAGPARLPHRAWEIAKLAVTKGPVLVQVARRGYVPGLACQDCRAPARCPSCAGPLSLGSTGAAPTCRWCATSVPGWRCAACGSGRLRARAVGSRRTAEELGRAFPGVRVMTSGGDHVLQDVPAEPALVVATPGAEPVAIGGYAAVLLLDAHAHLSRVSLRAGEETARRWFAASALARPQAPVVVTADASSPLVQALIRWDPGWLAERELAERASLLMPPAVRAATLTGSPAAVREALDALPAEVRVLGPLPAGERVRALLTAPRSVGDAMTRALQGVAATRTARKDPEPLVIAVDPLEWGTD
ncbi:MAG: primosome assembly protein PriA, partial [Candidatus Nanopelagicales bacterium]